MPWSMGTSDPWSCSRDPVREATPRCSSTSWKPWKSAGPGPAGPRTRPERTLADKAYSSKATRQYLRERGIGCVIPKKDDQKADRIRKGS